MLPSEFVEKGWTQGAFARDKDGKSVLSRDPTAVSWCMAGAVIASQGCDGLTEHERWQLNAVLGRNLGFTLRLMYNDTPGRTQKEVVNVLREAEYHAGLREEYREAK